jgi:hypothetical protein
MKHLIIIMVLLFAIPAKTDTTQELTDFISDFLRLYPQRQTQALTYIPTIIAECGEDIDPLLIAVIISMESSWKFDAEGERGERGLLQIMPRYGRNFRLDDPLEQIRAGVDHFRRALTMCDGNLKDAINAYGCGQCKPHRRFLQWRWRWYRRAIRRYRKSD